MKTKVMLFLTHQRLISKLLDLGSDGYVISLSRCIAKSKDTTIIGMVEHTAERSLQGSYPHEVHFMDFMPMDNLLDIAISRVQHRPKGSGAVYCMGSKVWPVPKNTETKKNVDIP